MRKYDEVRQILLNLYLSQNLSEREISIRYSEYISKLRKLAYTGDSDAQYDLAQHYESSGFFGNPNPFYNNKKRFYWYYKSAKNNNASAYNNLADLIERGDGCKKDLTKALSFYEKSKELGDVLGAENYKIMFKNRL